MLYIRADMNRIIATGHVMRCLAIADAAEILGRKTTFILADDQAEELIKQRGHKTIILHTEWNNMDTELEQLKNIIMTYKIHALLVDSYQVTPNYLKMLSEYTKVAYMDDLNGFLYPVHTLICYANYWKKFSYEERYQNTHLLLGMEHIESVLLLSGGTDNFHLLEGFLEVLKKNKYQRINVICGVYYFDFEHLCEQYKDYQNINFYQAVSHMEEYMMEADVAVSAGGTTLYELCACGTPTITYSCADNQLNNVLQFQEDGLMAYAGDIRNTNIFKKTEALLKRLDDSYQLRKECSEKMQGLVDGNGSIRIAEELIKFS